MKFSGSAGPVVPQGCLGIVSLKVLVQQCPIKGKVSNRVLSMAGY